MISNFQNQTFAREGQIHYTNNFCDRTYYMFYNKECYKWQK